MQAMNPLAASKLHHWIITCETVLWLSWRTEHSRGDDLTIIRDDITCVACAAAVLVPGAQGARAGAMIQRTQRTCACGAESRQHTKQVLDIDDAVGFDVRDTSALLQAASYAGGSGHHLQGTSVDSTIICRGHQCGWCGAVVVRSARPGCARVVCVCVNMQVAGGSEYGVAHLVSIRTRVGHHEREEDCVGGRPCHGCSRWCEGWGRVYRAPKPAPPLMQPGMHAAA
eukprot:COSAG01_NODE_27621_length_681_cov_0.797251_1_plen_226_part_11